MHALKDQVDKLKLINKARRMDEKIDYNERDREIEGLKMMIKEKDSEVESLKKKLEEAIKA
jgi:predicted RNase H-like nuclease (RuvC/YqgF family)